MAGLGWLVAGSKEHSATVHRVQSVSKVEVGTSTVELEIKKSRMMASAHAILSCYRDCAP